MVREQLIELLAPVVHDLGYQLWELEFASRSSGGLLRLYIDAVDGISLEDCERVSRAVSEVLDSSDPIQGHYTLEVSSPGLDRVLRTREHFSAYVGEQVRVEMKQLVEGRRRFVGRLVEVADDEIVLEVDGAKTQLPLSAIHKARLAPWPG
jgi:ribosome maturation factor RimP